MNHYKSLLLYCCLGVQFAVDAVVIRREYYRPYPDDPTGAKMKSLRSIMYTVNMVSTSAQSLDCTPKLRHAGSRRIR
jgi:hypothetical protein